MNIFLVHEDPVLSARMLAQADPVRARKQLLECCQLLAHLGPMYKADNTEYKLAHPNHPITRHMKASFKQYLLCYSLAENLRLVFPDHACSKSLRGWIRCYNNFSCSDKAQNVILCRKGQPPIFVQTLAEYAAIMREYCINVKGIKL